MNDERGPEGLAEVRKAYEFTLDCLGQDMCSGSLWQEYILLLQSVRPGTAGFGVLFPNAVAGQEEVTRTQAIRWGGRAGGGDSDPGHQVGGGEGGGEGRGGCPVPRW